MHEYRMAFLQNRQLLTWNNNPGGKGKIYSNIISDMLTADGWPDGFKDGLGG